MSFFFPLSIFIIHLLSLLLQFLSFRLPILSSLSSLPSSLFLTSYFLLFFPYNFCPPSSSLLHSYPYPCLLLLFLPSSVYSLLPLTPFFLLSAPYSFLTPHLFPILCSLSSSVSLLLPLHTSLLPTLSTWLLFNLLPSLTFFLSFPLLLPLLSTPGFSTLPFLLIFPPPPLHFLLLPSFLCPSPLLPFFPLFLSF